MGHPLRTCLKPLLGLLLAAAVNAAPQRVVSTNLCTDQLLLLLAEPQQIQSLSRLAHDVEISFMADRAAPYPANGAGVEELIALRPDLVLASSYTSRLLIDRLREQGIRVETLPAATSIGEIQHNIRTLAVWLDAEKRGEALIRQMLQRIAETTAASDPPRLRALFLQPNGYTSGRGTLQDEALRLAGWDNLARELDIGGYRPIDLETLIALAPDAIFTSSQLNENNALAMRILHHPALDSTNANRNPQTIDYRYWICGGPMLADAVERLTAERERLTGELDPPQLGHR